MEILYKKEKEEADQLLEQQRLVSSHQQLLNQTHFVSFLVSFFFSRGCRYVSNNVTVDLIEMKL